MTLTVTKIHPDLWEEADKAGLLWEQGLPGSCPGYLINMPAEYGVISSTEEIRLRMLHTSEYFRIGLLVED